MSFTWKPVTPAEVQLGKLLFCGGFCPGDLTMPAVYVRCMLLFQPDFLSRLT